MDAIDAFDVELLPEIEGIAEGAGVPAEHVLAINLRTELMYGLDARGRAAGNRPGVGECTAIAVAGEASADGHVLVAQNWDWSPVTRKRASCSRARRTTAPDSSRWWRRGCWRNVERTTRAWE